MATPLAELLDLVLSDADARDGFADAPADFMVRHGYEHLDADDVQEALFVLADGSPPAMATVLIDGGRAVDTLDPAERGGLAGAIAGLSRAFVSMFGVDVPEYDDPAELDSDAEQATDGPSDAFDDEGDDRSDDESDDRSEDEGDDQGNDNAELGSTAVDTPVDVGLDLARSERPSDNDDSDDPDLIDVLEGLDRLDDVSLAPEPLPPVPEEFDDGWGDVII